VVELAAAAAFAALALTVDEVLPLLAYGWMAAVGIVLAVVDLSVHRLPDRLTALLAAGTAVFLAAQALITGAGFQFAEAMAAGAGAALFYFLTSLFTAGGIGLGDAKLAFGLGLAVGWSGWPSAVFSMTLGLALTGLTAVGLLVLRRAERKDSIPHGPFMMLATVSTVVLTHL
jgi:leader peptidase (prepilin peptidase)/N-methyltransferase